MEIPALLAVIIASASLAIAGGVVFSLAKMDIFIH